MVGFKISWEEGVDDIVDYGLRVGQRGRVCSLQGCLAHCSLCKFHSKDHPSG